MCGIFGFWLKRELTDSDLSLGKKGRDLLTHRGPDDAGEWFDKAQGVYLGHRRLSIIDLSKEASQPFVDKKHVLAYNGELYNYLELKKTLSEKGHNFHSHSDTEVLLRSWQEWGKSALDHFDGMYAFALWDQKTLHIATDPFGEKPLYLLEREEGVYFSSEAQVLVELFNLSPSLNETDIAQVLALGFIAAPDTAYEKLYNVPAASYWHLEAPDSIKKERYWTLPEKHIGKGQIQTLTSQELQTTKDILLESLERRIRSDVPLGVFLSAGVDSSLVAALIAKELNKDILSLTVSFGDGKDESQEAQAIANHLGLQHIIINSHENDDWKDAPSLLKSFYGGPNDNMTALSVYQMSLLAKKHITVALTGVGGDEICYGYNKYHFMYQWRRLYNLPQLLWKSALPLDRPILNNKIKNFLLGTDIQRFINIKNSGCSQIFNKLPLELSNQIKEVFQGNNDLVYRAATFDSQLTLPNSYIPATERGSMRASLEVRTPFLSRHLFTHIASIDQRKLLAFGQKHLLKTLLYDYVPESLLPQHKQGFVFPLKRYLDHCTDTSIHLPSIPEKLSRDIWQNRNQHDYRGIAFRLKLLQSFQD